MVARCVDSISVTDFYHTFVKWVFRCVIVVPRPLLSCTPFVTVQLQGYYWGNVFLTDKSAPQPFAYPFSFVCFQAMRAFAKNVLATSFLWLFIRRFINRIDSAPDHRRCCDWIVMGGGGGKGVGCIVQPIPSSFLLRSNLVMHNYSLLIAWMGWSLKRPFSDVGRSYMHRLSRYANRNYKLFSSSLGYSVLNGSVK